MKKERRLFYRTKLDLKIPSKDNPGGYLPLYRIPPGEYTETEWPRSAIIGTVGSRVLHRQHTLCDKYIISNISRLANVCIQHLVDLEGAMLGSEVIDFALL